MQPIHVLFGTESNNSADLADRTADALKKAGLPALAVDMADFDAKQLVDLRTLVIVTSTYGNGDPPSNAEALHAYVMKSAPALPNLRFAVCALGDKTYDRFCNCGREFDKKLGELGGKRVIDRQDCDVDYEKPWKAWLDKLVPALKSLSEGAEAPAPAMAPVEKHEAAPGTRRNPVEARLTHKRVLCGSGSTKETIHVELAIGDLQYEPGDSLGVWPTNDPALVDEILALGPFDGEAKVALKGAIHDSGLGAGGMSLRQALMSRLDLAHVDPRLNEVCGAPFVQEGHVIDVLEVAQKPITPQQLAESLRPIAPRQYSIASSLRAHPREAHFTIDVVRYPLGGRDRKGVASTWFCDRLPVGALAPLYVYPSPHFRLPADDVPIVMIGPGTGVAPFRAFLEEREARGAKGKSWLLFGARTQACDFLYRDDIEGFLARGTLTRFDGAWSRDQAHKVYVQDKLRENADTLRAWVAEGAVLYVCGDAKRMAPDVQKALIEILGETTVHELESKERYRKDVY
jgi:sulfite reductase (NADPH) flavoprotein alpha-component